MDFKIRYLEDALADLEEIFAYSSAEYPETTPKFISSILEHIHLLERFPRLGKLVPGRGDVRVLIHTPVQVFYRVREEDHVVELLQVRHSSRR